MGRFSKLERETQDALAREKAREKKKVEAPEPSEFDEYDAPYYIKEADDAFFTGRFRNALQLYSRAISIDNSLHYPWIGQIYCLINLKQLKEADLWASRALELFPEDSVVLSLRASLYASRGMYKRALNTSDYAISRKGASAHSYLSRGYVLLEADNKNTHFCFTKALELAKPGDWKIPMHIGMIYFRKKMYARALEFFQTACGNNIKNYYLWHHLGYCYEKLGLGQKALKAYEHSINHNPDFKPARKGYERVCHSSFLGRLFRRLNPFRRR